MPSKKTEDKAKRTGSLSLTMRATPSLSDVKELLADIGRALTGKKKQSAQPPDSLSLTLRTWASVADIKQVAAETFRPLRRKRR